MKTMIILFVLAWQGAAGLLFAQKLTLEVRGFEAIKGWLNVAFYHSQETFMKEPLATFRVDVVAPTLSIPCKGLPAGAYAVALFQDENGNDKLDTTAFGAPTEKYGFSNDARGVMGPPSYDKCVFYFTQDTTLVVHVK